MKLRTVSLCGSAGLTGAIAMFVGDMLFYGQWGSGREALTTSFDVVRQADPARLALGGFLSILGGFGYALGSGHVYGQMSKSPPWLKVIVSGAFLWIAIIATATHAVWGSFALATQSDAANTVIWDYLAIYFKIGGFIGTPISILLAGAIALGRTDWPIWFALISPGALYLILSLAGYLPAPLGAPIVGGAFNLAFAIFYAVSLLQSYRRPTD